MKASLRIIGIGNPLMGDDGAGIAAAQRLQQAGLGPEVEVIDGGTAGLALLDLMEGAARVVLVDAVRMGLAPGQVCCFTPAQMILHPDSAGGAHGGGLAEVLALGEVMNLLPPLRIWGIEPQNITPGIGLSEPVKKGLELLLKKLLEELRPMPPYSPARVR